MNSYSILGLFLSVFLLVPGTALQSSYGHPLPEQDLSRTVVMAEITEVTVNWADVWALEFNDGINLAGEVMVVYGFHETGHLQDQLSEGKLYISGWNPDHSGWTIPSSGPNTPMPLPSHEQYGHTTCFPLGDFLGFVTVFEVDSFGFWEVLTGIAISEVKRAGVAKVVKEVGYKEFAKKWLGPGKITIPLNLLLWALQENESLGLADDKWDLSGESEGFDSDTWPRQETILETKKTKYGNAEVKIRIWDASSEEERDCREEHASMHESRPREYAGLTTIKQDYLILTDIFMNETESNFSTLKDLSGPIERINDNEVTWDEAKLTLQQMMIGLVDLHLDSTASGEIPSTSNYHEIIKEARELALEGEFIIAIEKYQIAWGQYKDLLLSGETFEIPLRDLLPPLKQTKNGVEPNEVLCKENFFKLFKIADGSIICVKSANFDKLQQLNIAKI